MSVTAPKGWLAAGVAAGTKPSGDLDLALVVSEQPATVAGAFTTSKVPSAHVQLCRPLVATGTSRGFCVSAGIANAFTGADGVADAQAMAAAAADAAGVPHDQMLVAATGTIGNRLPMDIVTAGIARAAEVLSADGGENAANAIRTTDAYAKTAVRTVNVDGATVTIGGMAKGAGMIAPRMVPVATLLVYVTTDASVTAARLSEILEKALPLSFNAITVDGCMSTSDTVLVFANGAAGVDASGSAEFEAAVTDVMRELAYSVVADGEGATRVIRVQLSGAASDEDAYAVSKEIASSILLRCAIFGGDPNFGRIVQALGQADAAVDHTKVGVTIAGVELSVGGVSTNRTDEAAKAMTSGGDVVIEVDLGLGTSSFEYLTCDLTPDYVRFNADYTT